MLKEHVNGHGLSGLGVLDLIEQVGLALAQLLVDEGAVALAQGRPVEAAADGVGQCVPEQAGGLAGIGEDGAEEPVVRLMDVGHGGGYL